ncbi:DivIVA domain-containing protein [Micromonospora sp. C31]|uniref:DivIVA domain-containing protein n=1 Tax=Micromonospora sp. C31 TaxID=2824876 RepID=UPI001B3759D4|nr:DivIVA domain-containing protein [Micromonospora sp. C31]MBQ1072778.1 DivIVA domain-containing protein [Micromonospora sp. C31]
MGQVLLLLVVALTVAAVVFGVTVLVSGRDPGLAPAEPDGRAVPLPAGRPLGESDVGEVRFDTALRGYRMAQVDHAMRRAAYDIGYKSELIGVLEAEVTALREGRTADADALRKAREQAAAEPSAAARGTVPVGADRPEAPGDTDVVVEPIPAFAGPAAGSTAGAATRGDDAATGRAGAGDDGGTGRAAADGVAERSGAGGTTQPAGDATGDGPVVGSEPR